MLYYPISYLEIVHVWQNGPIGSTGSDSFGQEVPANAELVDAEDGNTNRHAHKSPLNASAKPNI